MLPGLAESSCVSVDSVLDIKELNALEIMSISSYAIIFRMAKSRYY